jgi:glycosyltransferase involved in cell wall biosynthesis
MNRLYHLKETLIKNIEDNLAYENIEFVLLDYNSKDEIKSWVKEDLQRYTDMGILKFYSTSEPETFHRSHSRNVAMKLATGDIICNLDADNYLGKDFAFYVNYEFSFQEEIFLTSGFSDGSTGKICVRKKDFLAVRGYDERISGWGYEDDDLYARLESLGLKRIDFVQEEFVQFIEHEMEESFENDKNVTDIASIYIKHVDFNESDLLFLYKDGKFKYGTVIKPINDESDLQTELRQEQWQTGFYQKNENTFTLQFSKEAPEVISVFDPMLNDPKDSFHQVHDKELQNHLLIQLTSLENKRLYQKQRSSRVVTPNPDDWGETHIIA